MEFTPGGGIRIVNGSLRQILTLAYDVEKFQISGGPGWIDSQRFDVIAKGAVDDAGWPAAEQRKRAHSRLQSLLAERFQLSVRRETKDAPIFALIVGKNGPKLQISNQGLDGLSGRPGQLIAERAEVQSLAAYLSGQLGRPVLDRTGLKGTYKFKLDWSPGMDNTQADTEKAAAAGLSAADPSMPSLFTALQDQLGLKLDAQRGPMEIIFIDRAEKPAAN